MYTACSIPLTYCCLALVAASLWRQVAAAPLGDAVPAKRADLVGLMTATKAEDKPTDVREALAAAADMGAAKRGNGGLALNSSYQQLRFMLWMISVLEDPRYVRCVNRKKSRGLRFIPATAACLEELSKRQKSPPVHARH